MRSFRIYALVSVAAMMLVSCEKELDIKYRDIDLSPS